MAAIMAKLMQQISRLRYWFFTVVLRSLFYAVAFGDAPTRAHAGLPAARGRSLASPTEIVRSENAGFHGRQEAPCVSLDWSPLADVPRRLRQTIGGSRSLACFSDRVSVGECYRVSYWTHQGSR